MSSAEKIICETCKKYQRSSVDNTNQSGGFLQKKKNPSLHRSLQTGEGMNVKIYGIRAASSPSQSSLRDARFPLLSLRDIFPRPGEVGPQSGSPWQSTQSSSLCQGLSLWERWMRPAGADGEGEPAGNFMKLRSHSAPASCRGGSADRSTASGTPSPDTSPSRCSAARRRSTALPDSRSLPGTPTWTRCSRSW